MKAVIQRVLNAELKIDGVSCCKIEKGLLVYLGFAPDDGDKQIEYIIDRIGKMRIFEDENGKINLDVSKVNGDIMLVPNFTLYADADHGRRPSFSGACPFDRAKELFDMSVSCFERMFFTPKKGVFGADMKIQSVADGPINVLLEVRA